MGDCERCGRPKAQTREAMWPGNRSICQDVPALGDEMSAYECEVAAAAYHRGLRAGVELAKDKAFIWERIALSEIDWTDVDAALAEKVKV